MQKETPIPLPFIYGIQVQRCLIWTMFLSFLMNIGLVASIFYLLPLKEKEIYFVEFKSDRQNFVHVEKAGKDISTNELIISQSLRRYVMLRTQVTSNFKIDKKNFDTVCAMSTTTVSNQYSEQSKKLYEKKNFQREVQIDNDSVIGDKTHSVKFTIHDKLPNGKTRSMTRIAYIQYEFRAQENVPFDKKLQNPTGLIVNEYYISSAN